ncbi:Enolase [Bienertia sinuspersici]
MWVTSTPTLTLQSFLPSPISFTPFSKLPQLPSNTPSTLQLRHTNPHPPITTLFASIQDTGGLGQALLNTLEPGPTQEEKPNKGNEISGSDILRALQKASAKKANNKKQNKKKGSSELKRKNNNIEKKVVDFDKVRPITIKSDWATRLTELEKRLQEFSVY